MSRIAASAAAATTSTKAAAATASRSRRGLAASSPSAELASATSSAQLDWRSSGSLASARVNTASIAAGSAEWRADADGGSSSRWAKSVATSEATREGTLARKALEQHAAEPIDIRVSVDLVAADLLRSDVVDRAEQRAVRRLTVIRRALREPEVGQVAVATLVDQYVRRLDVAVDEPLRMSGVERARDLRDDLDCPGGSQRALTSKHGAQVAPST